MKFPPSEIISLLKSIYSGRYNALNLPVKLYLGVSKFLETGVYNGYGKNIIDVEYNSPDFKMLKDLRENIYLFSAAKTFNYVLSTENLITEGNKVLPFKEFKERAKHVYDQYNDTWLQTEYDNAIGQAQLSRAWNDFPEDAILEYMTSKDANVSDTCRSMEGVTRPKSDPIWVTQSPKNHWGCRCELIHSFENVSKPLPKGIIDPSPEFAFNPGIKREVFDKSHPYFQVEDKYKAFAKNNFGMPLPKNPKK